MDWMDKILFDMFFLVILFRTTTSLFRVLIKKLTQISKQSKSDLVWQIVITSEFEVNQLYFQ
ncbi:hypothetical protein Mgra_00007456 [Meloidogyne graminicola]|uniref:Uncharacterized protein n=1 Tax=Meloidogyne graminicola TaxID=189291 RepID=A0A8S9ZIS6_9BILA|nr:hypothetical protein Mgra_00007456 [Meloidogyne graminicola]